MTLDLSSIGDVTDGRIMSTLSRMKRFPDGIQINRIQLEQLRLDRSSVIGGVASPNIQPEEVAGVPLIVI
jgi:hypothetical protein